MKLNELRKKLNLSQIQIAEHLNISQSNYSKYERNEIEPDIETLKKLVDYFHTTIDYLVDHDVPYLINKSQFSEKQLNIIDKIGKLDNNQCDRLISYIDGLSDGKNDSLK